MDNPRLLGREFLVLVKNERTKSRGEKMSMATSDWRSWPSTIASGRQPHLPVRFRSRCSGPPNFGTSFPVVSRYRGTSILP